MRFARSREKNKFFFRFFSLLFASNFSLPTKAKLIVLFFALFRLQKYFVSLPIFSFRFKAKRNKLFFASYHHTRYRHKKVKDQPSYFSSILYKLSKNFTLSFFALKFSLLFRFVFASFHFFELKRKKICFHFASKRKRWQFFASVLLHFASKRKGWQFFASFSLHFASKQKCWQFFASFSFCFRFVPFSFCFRSLRFASMRNKRKKAPFFASKRKKYRFRFSSFRFEAKMTAHPRYDTPLACS